MIKEQKWADVISKGEDPDVAKYFGLWRVLDSENINLFLFQGGRFPSLKESKIVIKALQAHVKQFKGREKVLERCQEIENEWRSSLYRQFSSPISKELKRGSIYLGAAENHRFTKIGFSSNPALRERTLQAEDPGFKFIFSSEAKFTTRDEVLIHEKYAYTRKRGEWFDLTPEEIQDIQETLK